MQIDDARTERDALRFISQGLTEAHRIAQAWAVDPRIVTALNFFGESHAWPPLNAAQTGTEFDLAERLWVLAAGAAGKKSVFLTNG